MAQRIAIQEVGMRLGITSRRLLRFKNTLQALGIPGRIETALVAFATMSTHRCLSSHPLLLTPQNLHMWSMQAYFALSLTP